MIRVLIVDDSMFMRTVLKDLLSSDPDIQIVGDAQNGIEALEKTFSLKPDVITLDYEMPEMNGLQTLEKIMQLNPHPAVIMVSAYVKEGADITLQCLSRGAVDFVLKPQGAVNLQMNLVKIELIEKVKIASKTRRTYQAHFEPNTTPHRKTDSNFLKNSSSQCHGLIIIGASTGGPAALEVLLPSFSQNISYGIVVAQHLPQFFIPSFVQRLQKRCQIPVLELADNQLITSSSIYVSPGGKNTEIKKNNKGEIIAVTFSTEDIQSPSIDRLMISASEIMGDNIIGVLLTGMGRDGVLGMEAIKMRGGKTLVQNEETSIVYGMGKEAVQRGVVDDILPLDSIVNRITTFLA